MNLLVLELWKLFPDEFMVLNMSEKHHSGAYVTIDLSGIEVTPQILQIYSNILLYTVVIFVSDS